VAEPPVPPPPPTPGTGPTPSPTPPPTSSSAVPQPSADTRRRNRITWTIVGVVIVVGVIATAVSGGFKNTGGGGPGSDNALDERTCEIARSIAADFNVTDTLEESRQRVADLYSGYGQSASPALAAGIRQWVSGLTSGNLTGAANGVQAVDSACSAEGF
jgi:hypothetical protein